MPAAELERHVRAHFPHAQITIQALADDDDHYALTLVCSSFQGLTKLAQHQKVNAALKDVVGTQIHALSIRTLVPESAS